MIFIKMFKLFIKSVFIYFVIIFNSYSDEQFGQWLKNFQIEAIKSGISKDVVVDVMSNAKFLPKVIEYDRYQPEFYEDTFTYIKKRSTNRKIREGIKLYKEERDVIEKIEKEFQVEKDYVNYGLRNKFWKYLGKWILFQLSHVKLR